jgi:hypothetical protein
VTQTRGQDTRIRLLEVAFLEADQNLVAHPRRSPEIAKGLCR